MYLADLEGLAQHHSDRGSGFQSFRADRLIASLDWPDDVLEQWLYEHPDHFIPDYPHVDLSAIGWAEECIELSQFMMMPTGASESDLIAYNAARHEYLVEVRNAGVHVGVRESWQSRGTWKRSPLLIERSLVDPAATGLQVVEGRTRVGILRGRAEQGFFVASEHLAWVGRSRRPANETAGPPSSQS